MGKRGNSNAGTIAVIALVAFAIGKCSGGEPKPESDEAPQAFVSPVQPGYEPEPPPPQRFVDDEPQRAFGSRPFRNCSEARAAGAAPVRAGDPGYGPHLDRDRDGVGCE
jgi:hypothetical protein